MLQNENVERKKLSDILKRRTFLLVICGKFLNLILYDAIKYYLGLCATMTLICIRTFSFVLYSGLAAEAVRMPCSFHYTIPNPLPPLDYIKQIQPELAANVNRLLHTLSA